MNNNLRLFYFLCLIVVNSIETSAQTTFQTTFEDSMYNEIGNCIQATFDGGYIICGGKDYYIEYIDEKSILIKTDCYGQIEWMKTYGSSQSGTRAEYILQQADSGYIFIGNHRGGCIFVIRTDANGDTIWANKPTQIRGNLYTYRFQETDDNNFVFVGSEMLLTGMLNKTCLDTSHIILVKINANGTKLWEKDYTLKGNVGTFSMTITFNGDYILSGSSDYESTSYRCNKLIIMKTNSNGDSLWCKYYDENVVWWKNNVLETFDKEILILVNSFEEKNNVYNILLLKVDSKGQIIWRKIYGEEYLSYKAFSIIQTRDRGYLIGGKPNLIKIDGEGNVQWKKNYHDSFTCFSVIQTSDNGYALTGCKSNHRNDYYESDIMIIKTDNQGNITRITYPLTANSIKNYTLHQNFPNPFNSSTTIAYELLQTKHTRIKIYNSVGKLIRTLVDQNQKQGYYHITWDGRDNSGDEVASGTYFYKLEIEGDFISMKKMNLLK